MIDKANTDPLLVSVIMPTYNRAHLIKRALDSVLDQIIEGDEVIVVDDGSTDNTEEALSHYRHRILYLRVPNGGAGRARNIGIRMAKNPLIAFLDSDDEWMPGKLELQRTLLQARADVLFCFSDLVYRYVSEQEQRRALFFLYKDPFLMEKTLGVGVPFSSVTTLPKGQNDVLLHFGNLYPSQMERQFVQVNTLVIRRSIITAKGLIFPEDLRVRQDWAFVGMLAREGLAAYLDCETSWVYNHNGPQLTKLDYIIYLECRLKLLERVWGEDNEFLKDHQERYEKIHDDVLWNLIKELLCRGKNKEAKRKIAGIEKVPIQYRIFIHLPYYVNQVLFKIRDKLLHEVSST